MNAQVLPFRVHLGEVYGYIILTLHTFYTFKLNQRNICTVTTDQQICFHFPLVLFIEP